MRLNAVKVLGINITIDPKEKILEEIEKYLSKSSKLKVKSEKLGEKPLIIVTPNPEQIVYAASDSHFTDILNRADVAIPDGIGTVWGLRKIRRLGNMNSVKRISGVDLMEELVSIADKQGVKIGLIGGKGNLAVDTLECLQKKHPKLIGWGEDGPECTVQSTLQQNSGQAKLKVKSYGGEKEYFKTLIEKIITTQTQIVFVGLGAPKQEYFIEQLKVSFDKTQVKSFGKTQDKQSALREDSGQAKLKVNTPLIFMSVGGAFEMISGRVKRAPGWIRSAGFEWAWRLAIEPWRWRRQLALARFVWLVMRERYVS